LSVGFVGLKLLFKWLSAGWVVGGDFHPPTLDFWPSVWFGFGWPFFKIFAYKLENYKNFCVFASVAGCWLL